MPPLVPPDPPLSDGVVTLRGWRDGDARPLAAMMDDDEVARWTRAPSPYRERDALEWLALQPALLRRRSELPLAIVDAHGGALLGSISLRLGADARGELGYLVARDTRRMGVGARAVRLVACWAFETLELRRLELFVQPANVASLALAARIGFRREGVLREYSAFRGRRVDMVILGLLPDELGGT